MAAGGVRVGRMHGAVDSGVPMARRTATRTDSVVATLAERIVRQGGEVRRRIRDLTVQTYRQRRLDIDGLAPLVEEVLLGVVAGLAGVSKPQRDELLRQVFEGLADAYAATAEHSRRTQRWEEIEDRITSAVGQFAHRAGEEIMSEYRNVGRQIREAGERLKPRAQAAIHAIDEKVVEPASEVAAQGAKKVRRTLGVLLAAAGEMLHDLGDTIKDVRASEAPAGGGKGSGGAAGKAARGAASKGSTVRPTRTAKKQRAKPARAASGSGSEGGPAGGKKASSKVAKKSARPSGARGKRARA